MRMAELPALWATTRRCALAAAGAVVFVAFMAGALAGALHVGILLDAAWGPLATIGWILFVVFVLVFICGILVERVGFK